MTTKPQTAKRAKTYIAGLLAATALAAPMTLSPAFLSGGDVAQARSEQAFRSWADVVEAMRPAVVTITARRSADGGSSVARPDFPDGSLGDLFRFFEERGRGFGGRPFRREAQSLGSGFIVDPSGVIVTNHHVIKDASEISILLDDGSELEAKLLGRDERADLAVLKVESDTPLPAVAWADSDEVRVGDPAMAIGNPFGLAGTATAGIVSARGRDIDRDSVVDFLQVDTPINRGNSGGPLFNEHGGVIGVNTAIYSRTGDNNGIGFAIPSNQALAVVRQLQEKGYVERGFLSVSIQTVTDDLAASLGMEEPMGAMVAKVTPGGAADQAGVKNGDVIIGFAGVEIKNTKDLQRAVRATTPGAERAVTVWRRGKAEELTVVLGRMDGSKPVPASLGAPEAPELTLNDLGLKLSNRGRGEGVLIASVDPKSPAARAKLRPGDRILEVQYEPVSSPRQVAEAIDGAKDDGRDAAFLKIDRGGDPLYIGLPLGG